MIRDEMGYWRLWEAHEDLKRIKGGWSRYKYSNHIWTAQKFNLVIE